MELKWCYTRRFATTIFRATPRLTIVTTLFRMATTCNAVLLPFNQQRPQQLRKRFEKWIRAASNFIALVTPRAIRQLLAFFLRSWIKKDLHRSSGIEKESRCLVLASSSRREIRHFHVVRYPCSNGKETYKKAWCTCRVAFISIVVDVAVVVAKDPWYFYVFINIPLRSSCFWLL